MAESIVVSVSVPLSLEKNGTEGVLVGAISLGNIIEYIRSFCPEPECAIFLVDKSGKVFAHSHRELLSTEEASLLLDYGDHPLVRDMQTGNRNHATKQFEVDNISYFGTYEKVRLNGWGVVLQQPLSVLHAETEQLEGKLILFNILFCIVVLGVAVFITRNILQEQRNMQEELSRSEERFRSFVESANDIVYEISLDGRFTYVSPHWKDIVGHDVEEVLNRDFADFVYSEDAEKCRTFFHSVITTGEKQEGVEYRVKRKDGQLRWHRSHGSPIKNEKGEVVSYLGIGRDITDRKQKEAELEKMVQEKDFLLREINHRVENNLNMINALINLKAADSGEEFTDIINQINAIRLVHEKLYQTTDVMEIDVRHYLDDLLQTVFTSFSEHPVVINNNINANRKLPTKKAIALGLNLISTLADQLDGDIELKKSPSPEYTVRFPKS